MNIYKVQHTGVGTAGKTGKVDMNFNHQLKLYLELGCTNGFLDE